MSWVFLSQCTASFSLQKCKKLKKKYNGLKYFNFHGTWSSRLGTDLVCCVLRQFNWELRLRLGKFSCSMVLWWFLPLLQQLSFSHTHLPWCVHWASVPPILALGVCRSLSVTSYDSIVPVFRFPRDRRQNRGWRVDGSAVRLGRGILMVEDHIPSIFRRQIEKTLNLKVWHQWDPWEMILLEW